LSSAPDLTEALRVARKCTAAYLLEDLSAAEREKLLLFYTEEKLFSPPLLDQDTLAAVAGHIAEVCEEWRWMW
jgi:hypothetical protein